MRGITTDMTMLDDFLTRAALAGVGLSLATGPLGSFVVWRKMAYFGDATAHAAILGVALALAFDLPVGLGTLAVALLMAFTVATLAARGWAMDTTLGVLAHSALAIGLVVALLIWRWQQLLTSTLNADLAFASGVNPDRERLILTLALAVVVAVALKVVGALLIAAMLIIPAAAARALSRTPEAMAALAVLFGVGASLVGLGLSLWQDTPAGPSIVAAAAGIFALSAVFGRVLRH